MRIFTSYYKNIGFLKTHGVLPVSISRFPPSDFDGPVVFTLAPSADLLMRQKSNPDWKQYRIDFYGQLIMNDVAALCDELHQISDENGGCDLALCCYEEPKMNCHRHIVADFMNEFGILGGNVHEYTGKDTLPEFDEALF